MPDAITNWMAEAVRAVVTNENFRGRVLEPGYFRSIGSAPEAFAALIAQERSGRGELVQQAAIVPVR